jgi:hypothetical protein
MAAICVLSAMADTGATAVATDMQFLDKKRLMAGNQCGRQMQRSCCTPLVCDMRRMVCRDMRTRPLR